MKKISIESGLATGIFFLVLFCLTYILHNNIFDRDLVGPHTWRQSYTMQNIQCFYEEDNNILHPRRFARGSGDGIQRQEFPIMQWTAAQCSAAFGNSIRTIRIFCFLLGLFSIAGFFLFLQQLTKHRITLFAGTFIFAFSPLLFYYMMNPLPDLFAFACAIWAMFLYAKGDAQSKFLLFYAATFFLCLATLAKLPYIVFGGIPLGLLIRYWKNVTQRREIKHLLLSGFLFAPAVIWYAIVLPEMSGNAVIAGVFSSSKDSYPFWDAFWGITTDSLPRIFLGWPALLLFLIGLWELAVHRKRIFREYLPYSLAGLLLLLYFFYEIKLISTVHDYYMMPFLPFLFGIVALGIRKMFNAFAGKVAAVALVISAPILTNYEIAPWWNPERIDFCTDWYIHRDELRAAVPDSAKVIMGNDHTMNIMPYYIHKRGWTYVDSEMQRFNIECAMKEGASYLYTNSAFTLSDTAIRPLLKREVGVYGEVHVFELGYAQ